MEALLRTIPKVDLLLERDEAKDLVNVYSRGRVTDALRETLDGLRRDILAGRCNQVEEAGIFQACRERLEQEQRMSQRVVINATGVMLHTNLGRSLLADCAADAAREAAVNYTTLEFDCHTGKRGDRYSHVEGLLQELLGVEAALVVNNNAAAVLLMLSALAKGREVVVSRGELVEIGGSFRVPEVMEQSGCILREVGATNKTHPEDYRRAITENTAALLKVHTSNYRIVGFTQEVSLEELTALGRETGLPVLHDLGSGAMLPLREFGVENEPIVHESIRQGADVVCFSGDKLLGGPQAGLIVGKRQYIQPMKTHPLLRALRVDKLTLAALEATLRLYRDPVAARKQIPLYRMMAASAYELKTRAECLCQRLQCIPGVAASVQQTQCQVGGGSVPTEYLPSFAVSVQPQNISLDELQNRLLRLPLPIVSRISRDCLLLDVRTIAPENFAAVEQGLRAVL